MRLDTFQHKGHIGVKVVGDDRVLRPGTGMQDLTGRMRREDHVDGTVYLAVQWPHLGIATYKVVPPPSVARVAQAHPAGLVWVSGNRRDSRNEYVGSWYVVPIHEGL